MVENVELELTDRLRSGELSVWYSRSAHCDLVLLTDRLPKSSYYTAVGRIGATLRSYGDVPVEMY